MCWRMTPVSQAIAQEPVAETQMMIAPDDRGARCPGRRRSEPPERLAQRAVLFHIQTLSSLYPPPFRQTLSIGRPRARCSADADGHLGKRPGCRRE